MKKKIIAITILFLLIGSVALGFTIAALSPEEAYEAANKNNAQAEIDKLNLELKQIIYDNSVKTAEYTSIDSYSGQLTKYVATFDNETNLEIARRNDERAQLQLKIDVIAAAIGLKNAKTSKTDAEQAFNDAVSEYNDAKNDSVSKISLMELEYAMESQKIALHQAVIDLTEAQRKLDDLLGGENLSVELPADFSNPYDIDTEAALDSANEIDIALYQARRNFKSASLKFDITKKFFNEDDKTYVSNLAALKSAELAYDKEILSLKISVYDDIDSLKTKYDSIELAKLNLALKLEEYEAAKTQFNAGIISELSLKNSENAYNAAEKQLDSKINDYILASMRFTMNTGYSF